MNSHGRFRRFLHVNSEGRLFRLVYAHAVGTPPLACIAPSECMLNNISAAFAGTVAEHAYVPTIVAASVRVVHICSNKSWLTRTNATGRSDLQTAKTNNPR